MNHKEERAQYFLDLVRRYNRALQIGDFQTTIDTKKALDRLGAVQSVDGTWSLNDDTATAV